MLTGTARARAMAETIMVPEMKARAPKTSTLGAHRDPVR